MAKLYKCFFYCILFFISLNALASSSVKEDSKHVNRWNTFADELYQLHQFHLQKISARTEKEMGGYPGNKNFFEETRYYHPESGVLLSRIQREVANSHNIHLIEVFVYDDDNHIKVDYLAAFLPRFRNAPIQTLINVHRYNDLLHSFRQFDASGALINEQCEGRILNKNFFITLDEDEIINRDTDMTDENEKNYYHRCFEFLPKQAGRYLRPANFIFKDIIANENKLEQQLLELTKLITTTDKNNRADAYLKRADIYFKQQAFEDAVKDYSQALAINKNLDKAYFGRGMALGRQGLVQQGIDDLSVYIARHPYDSHAYTKRGVRYIWLGNIAAAKKDLIEAVSLDVSNAEAHDDLGVVYASGNNFDKAIYHFKQSIYYDRTYQKAYHNLSLAYVVTENYTQALTQVDKGLRLQANNRNTLLLKSTILEKMGKLKEAQTIRENAEFLPEGNWSERFSLN